MSKQIIRMAVLGLSLLVFASVAWAQGQGQGQGGGKPDGGETAVNQLSFPLIMTGDPVATIPTASPMGGFSLAGTFYITDGTTVCDPAVSTCTITATNRVYLQKDPKNTWQAYSTNKVGTTAISHIDFGDNLESVPWRSTSVVRVEIVPFAASTMTGFTMKFVSGQGTDEVWGALTTGVNATATVETPGYATVQSACMALSMTKLDATAGSISVLPRTDYAWNPTTRLWTAPAGVPAVAQTVKVEPFGGEINVKGRLINGYNWNMKRQVMSPGVSKDGWWRITFYSTCIGASPLDFTTTTGLVDPTAPPSTESVIVPTAEGTTPNYPRVPVLDVANDIGYIDIYIEAASGKNNGSNGGK
jgi:hypothetical protein